MKLKLTFITLFSIAFAATAQDKWEYLPNVGLDSSNITRFQDVYFTNYHTGFTVNLRQQIFKTKDGGANWKLVADSTGPTGSRSIEFLDDGKTGLAGGFLGKISRSNDSGETWQDITSFFSDTSTVKGKYGICGISHFKNNFYAVGIWASIAAHFYRSKDRGLTWTTKYIDTSLANGLVDLVFLSEDTGFVCGKKNYYDKGPFGVVLKTTDGGNSWRKVYEGKIGTSDGIWKLQFIGSQFGVGSLQADDTIAMIKTTDGGETWNILGTGFKPNMFGGFFNDWTQSIGFATPLKGWMGGYFRGIVETNDGGITWDSVSFGRNFNRIFVIDSAHIYAGGSSVYRYGSGFKLGIPRNEQEMPAPHTLYPISPNPSNGKIKIEFDLSTNVVLQVFHAGTGRMWDVHRERMMPGHYSFYWQDASAPSGQYFVRLNNDEIGITQKFMLVK